MKMKKCDENGVFGMFSYIYIFYITMNVNIFNTFFDIILYTVC